MLLEALAVSALLVASLTFGAWTIYTWTKTELMAAPDWTSWAIYQTGRALVWVAIVVLAGGLFAAVVTGVVRVLGGGR